MGLREWLIILGGLILLLIIADGIRRMRKASQEQMDDEERARQEQLRRELPAGGARVVKTHNVDVFDDDPIPVLRHEIKVADEDLPSAHQAASDAGTDRYATSDEEDFDTSPSPYDTSAPSPDTDSDQPQYDTERQSESDAWHAAESYQTGFQDAPYESYEQAETEDNPISDDRIPDSAAETSEYSDSSYAQATEQAFERPEPEPDVSAESDVRGATFEPAGESLDDIEPLEPLEKRFAAAKARRESEHARLTELELVEAEAAALEEIDPVKAAARRIQGKHTGPRPLERLKMQNPASEEEGGPSLAEKEYLQQQKQQEEQEWAEQQAREAKVREEEEKKRNKTRSQSLLTDEEEREQIASADELLLIHVKCRDERGFHGSALMHVVMQCGMQVGDMQVFHRFVKTETGPEIQFSMLSSVQPGIFDMDKLDELYIPSVSFVMGLPAPGSSQECFSMMLETAKVIARYLNGELRDEDRSVMTPQTVEHYKQRIQEFERRKQLALKR